MFSCLYAVKGFEGRIDASASSDMEVDPANELPPILRHNRQDAIWEEIYKQNPELRGQPIEYALDNIRSPPTPTR